MKKLSLRDGNKNLIHLASFLEKLPRERFDYNRIVGADWMGAQDLSCGTTACAIGWAATISKFRKFGLHLTSDGDVDGANISSQSYGGTAVFSINEDEWDYLFHPNSRLWIESNGEIMIPTKALPCGPNASATPKQVAKHIRRFVAYRRAKATP